MEYTSSSYKKYAHQRTLSSWVTISGIGLHSGKRVELSIGPAPADSGIVFERKDLVGRPRVIANAESIYKSTYCTVLQKGSTKIATVEHLLAALYSYGIDNVTVILDAEEVPILDGSAGPFVQLIKKAKVRNLDAGRLWWRVDKPVEVRDGDRYLKVLPSSKLSIDCTVDFKHPLVTDQKYRFNFSSKEFRLEIASARTFGFLKDIGKMKQNGYAQGGSLDNAVVIDAFSIMNPDGLRFSDEFVRHKVLDIIGDFALLGGLLAAKVVAHKSGHALHHALIQKLSRDENCCVPIRMMPSAVQQDLPFDTRRYPLANLQRA
jgi:UDP-3-O-[3-hydroxymyristoyl] N-acetylglucosamine deacetylase